MEHEPLQTAVENLVKEYVAARGLEFVELIFRREGKNLLLRLAVDRFEGGITMGECSELNRALGRALEERNLIEASYILEVNSPGLDRPLKTSKDFARCLNRQVKFFLAEPIDGKIELDGIIQEVFDDGLDVLSKEGIARLPLKAIHKAKQVF